MPSPHTRAAGPNAQAAMEYLMTYGWAILIIAIAAVALYSLGIFGGGFASQGSACIAEPGYYCADMVMNTSGNLAANIGQSSGSTITINSIACTNSSSAPSSTTVISNTIMNSGAIVPLSFHCPGASGPVGKSYKGYLWIVYSSGQQSGLTAMVASFSATVQSVGKVTTGATTAVTTAISCYSLTLSGIHGTESAAPSNSVGCPSGQYIPGTTVTITATPSSGYAFSSWSGSGTGNYSGTSNPATVTMSSSITETATYSQAFTYSYGGTNSGSSATITSGYSLYLCSGVNGQYGNSTFSWTGDNTYYFRPGVIGTSIGHQSSNTCALSPTTPYAAVGGVGVSSSSYTIPTTGNFSSTSQTLSWSPSSTSAHDFLFIATRYSITSVTLPAGCTELSQYTGLAAYVYIASCTGYSSYSVPVVLSTATAWSEWTVYDVT